MKRSWLVPGVLVLGFLSPCRVVAQDSRTKFLLAQAEMCEQAFAWEKACEAYEHILRFDRSPEVRRKYFHALRRSWQLSRHRDPIFRQDIIGLKFGPALRLYQEIVDNLLDHSLDRKTVEPGKLLRKGAEELLAALKDPSFAGQNLVHVDPRDLTFFKESLEKVAASRTPLSRIQLVKQAREIALSGQARLQLEPTAILIELACGACYSFDEYTAYLTPTQLKQLCESLKGEHVGVGLNLAEKEGKILIADVAAGSPASEAMPAIQKDERILTVAGKPIRGLALEAIYELLNGPLGTSVDVEIYGDEGPRTVSLRRRALFTPSVTYSMANEFIGYLHIAAFQDTTLQEVDEAIAALQQNNMKALVLDLRGNTGGLFETAVEVARRFVANGIIVSLQNQDPKLSSIFQSRNPAALAIPMVVLVDTDTASSAEVLAGALKDNHRGKLVGQTTFGKGCTQSIVRLTPQGTLSTGGLRITVARFFSPEGQPFTGRGVHPHLHLPGDPNGPDLQFQEAILEAQRLAMLANPS